MGVPGSPREEGKTDWSAPTANCLYTASLPKHDYISQELFRFFCAIPQVICWDTNINCWNRL